jgi:hypothetical protein
LIGTEVVALGRRASPAGASVCVEALVNIYSKIKTGPPKTHKKTKIFEKYYNLKTLKVGRCDDNFLISFKNLRKSN